MGTKINLISKILIVEDNLDLSELYQDAFSIAGFEVRVSTEGLKGINQAVNFKPDLVLLDIMMPQMDGFEFLRAIKNNTSLECQIVINSNLDQKKDIEKSLALGADQYLKKSEHTPSDLVALVHQYNKTGHWISSAVDF
jgi:DNA-binding response OmpR family regulator